LGEWESGRGGDWESGEEIIESEVKKLELQMNRKPIQY